MTESQVIALIKTGQGSSTVRDYAAELGVSPGYITDLYKGNRSPGKKILQKFGIEKTRRTIVEYVQHSKR